MEVKSKKDKLFNLVKALSKSEKRYFHLYTKQHVIGVQNKYQILFKLIEKQKKYDEKKIIADFAKKKIKLNISSEKNYLYNLILKALRSYYSETDDEMKIIQLKMDYQILLKKELYKEADQRLKQLEKLCLKSNDSITLFENHFRRNIININLGLLPDNLDLLDFETEGDFKLETLVQRKKVYDIYNRLYYQIAKKIKLSIDEQNSYLAALDAKLNDIDIEQIDFDSKLFYYSSKNLIGFLSSNYLIREQAQEKLMTLVENNDYLISTNPYRVARILYNLFNSYSNAGKHDFAATIITKLEKLKDEAAIDQDKVEIKILQSKCMYFLNTLQYGKLVALEAKAKAMQLDAKAKATIFYNLSLGYFILEKYDEMLDWINDVVYGKKTKFREDIHSIYSVYSLICHFELGNFALLDNMTRNTLRNLKSKGKQNDFEKLIISFVKRSLNIIDKKESYKHLEKLKIEVDKFGKGIENQIFGFDTIKAWVNCKIDKKPLKQSLEEISIEEQKQVEIN